MRGWFLIICFLVVFLVISCLSERKAMRYIDLRKKLETVFVYDEKNRLIEYRELPLKTIETKRQEFFEFHGEIMYVIGAFLLSSGLIISVLSKNPVIERIGLFSFLGGVSLLASGLFLCLSASYFALIAVGMLAIAGIYLILKFWV